MSLTNPNEPDPRKKGYEAYVLAAFLSAVVLMRLSLSFSAPAPDKLKKIAQDAVESSVAPVSEVDTQRRSKLREPEISDVVFAPQEVTISHIREAAIRDQKRTAQLLLAFKGKGVDAAGLLFEALTASDDVLTVGISIAVHSLDLELAQDFDARLAKLISDGESVVRLGAIEVAGILGRGMPETLNAIRLSAFESDPRMKVRAITSLRRIGDSSPATYTSFIPAIRDGSVPLFLHAVSNLVQLVETGTSTATVMETLTLGRSAQEASIQPPLPPPSIPPQSEAVPEKIAQKAAKRSMKVAPKAADPAVVRVLTDALQRGSSQVRAVAALRLAELGFVDKIFLDDLRKLLRDPDPKVRFAAGFALKNFGLAAVPAIVDACGDKDPLVRLNALQLLESVDHSDPLVRDLVEQMFNNENDETVFFQVALAMLRVHPESERSVQTVVRELPYATLEIRGRIFEALKGASKDVVRAELTRASEDSDAALRYEALQAMISVFAADSPEVRETIRNHLKDGDVRVKRGAVLAEKRLNEPIEHVGGEL